MEEAVVTPIKKTPNGAELLTILGTEFHVERRKSYYKAQFIDLDGKRQVILIGRELFTYPSKVVAQLLKANATLPDDPNAAVKVVKRALANRCKKSRRITIRAGWHESSFVYPGETCGPLAGVLEHVGVDEIDPALGLKEGTPEGWREGLRKACEASDYLIFAASVAFSGPLFELAGEQEGIIFHFQPQDSPAALTDFKTKSSSGKTLSARCANSTIGRAQKTDLVSFAVTARALEDYCFTHHHLFAALDEEGRALVSTGKHIKPSQLPYQVTSGRGTLYSKKATRDSEFRNLTWLLPVITTGEKPLDDPKSQRVRAEGAQVRMAPIPVPPGAVGGIINRLGGTRDEIVRRAHVLARKVKKTLDENYGVAMPAYLKLLVPRRSSLKRYVRRTIDNFVKWARKLTTHGQVVLITLHRLQRIIKPRTIASAVVSELTNRGILIKSRDGETAHEIMIRGLHGQPVAAMSRSS